MLVILTQNVYSDSEEKKVGSLFNGVCKHLVSTVEKTGTFEMCSQPLPFDNEILVSQEMM